MIRDYCRSHQRQPGGLGAAPIRISIMTYTEDSKRGYTSHFTSEDAGALADYAAGLKLCQPPEAPSVSANGGDGEENVLQGLAEMYQAAGAGEVRIGLDEEVLCFLITDAPPHGRRQENAEARNERRTLVELGMADPDGTVDMYRVLDRFLDQRGGRVIFVPLMY